MAAWLISIFILLGPQAAWAGELRELTASGLAIRYDPLLERAAGGLAKVFPRLKRETEERLGLTLKAVPTVVLLSGREFRNYADNDLVTAFAVPGKNLIVIDYSKMERNPFDFDATVRHELAHLLLSEVSASGLPKWFDEGVAQWVSGGIADIMNPASEEALKRAVISGNLPDLRQLRQGFPGDPEGLSLAYQESKSFVEYMAKEYGEGKLPAILADMRNGKDLEQAVSENLFTDLATIEQKWRKRVSVQYPWIAYVADRIYWLLFLLAALATVAGYLRFRKRMKTYRDEEVGEDEDSHL